MTGAQALIQCLQEEGVEVIFGYPGGSVLPIYDALYDSSLRHVLTRHEQGAVHAADGYARATGRVGVCLATSGPGATNLITGLATSYMDSTPVVALTGQVGVSMLGRDAFQEADLTGITIPITKHNYLVKEAESIPRVVKEAFHIASTGRRGPVLIDLPKDVQNGALTFRYPDRVDLRGYKPTYHGHPTQIARAAQALNQAEKPVIVVGGGVIASGAADLCLNLAEAAGAPVVCTMMGLGGFPGEHTLFLGMMGMHGTVAANRALSEADLVLALGVRFDDRAAGRSDRFAPRARIIHVDIDPAEIGKNVRVDIPIVGDIRNILTELAPQVSGADLGPWMHQINGWRDSKSARTAAPEGQALSEGQAGRAPSEGAESLSDRVQPQDVIRTLRNVLRDEDVVVTDVGQHQMFTAQHYRFNLPRTLITSGGLGAMGFGLPAAIGAQISSPNKTVLLVTGDGSFQMNLQELATVVEQKLSVKIAIFNNGCLGMVRQWQELFHQKRYSSVKLAAIPDFVKLAEAYGLPAVRVESGGAVRDALVWAMEQNGPALIDFRMPLEENVFPMIPPGQSVEKTIVG
jgi:acetolactate synthase-1/2/3 large subunit